MSFTERLRSLAGHGAVWEGNQYLATCRYSISIMGTFAESINGAPVLAEAEAEAGEGELSRVTNEIPFDVALTLKTIDDGAFSFIATGITSSREYYKITLQ